VSFTSASTRATVATLSAWLESHDEPEPWVVETSGSTGRPKRVRLSRRAVLASVEASARRVGATGPWLLALPAAYVAGVQVICRSLVAGHDPVLLEDHPSFAAATAAMPAGDRFVSLVPTQLQRLLAEPESAAALATFHTVLLGGGPIDPALRERARAAGVRVVATYGSAETAGGCVYDGVPLDGVALAIDAGGRVRISGPTLFEGYEDDPELTASVLVDGWFLTSDTGRPRRGDRDRRHQRARPGGRRAAARAPRRPGGRGARGARRGVGQPGGGVRGRRRGPSRAE